jgi:proline iminopeptidase
MTSQIDNPAATPTGGTPHGAAVHDGIPGESRRALQPLSMPRELALVIAVVIPAAWGALAGRWTPRGPLTTAEVLAAMAVGVIVGAVAGVVLRSRWAMVVAPAVFALAFELVRLGTDGPTVDRPQLSAYGLLAFIVGRGFHGLVGLMPMALGAVLGAGAARRVERGDSPDARAGTPALMARRTVAAACAVGLVGLAMVVARPPSTPPILDAGGEPLPGSVAELTTVRAGDRQLGLMLRGASEDAPVVLFLAGGPGGSERGAMRRHLAALEESFVVATWDQRGTGTSYPALDPTGTLTLDAAVEDTLAVTDHLRERFDQERIYLLGQSYGSLLGVLVAQTAPERYHAYIGTGQMVDVRETDRIFYEDTIEWARREGDTGLVERLERIGPPPYERMLDYETALSHEQEVYPYDRSANSEGSGGFSENFIVPEYSFTDQVHLLGAFMDTFAALYPRIQDVDLRDSAAELELPVFFVQGAHEARGRAQPFEEWFGSLDAPGKDLVVLNTSGHRPLFEQPEEFVSYMEDVVLAVA